MKNKIVVVSGYFDPVHVGHIELLERAKSLGKKLIVIVNNDKQAELKKGKSFMCQEDRCIIMQSMYLVDEVFLSIDDDNTVCKSLEAIKPHIFANGGDRYSDEIPEAAVCKKYNIKIVDGLGKKVRSSSELIKNAGQKSD